MKTKSGESTVALVKTADVDVNDNRFWIRHQVDPTVLKDYEEIAGREPRLNGFDAWPTVWKNERGSWTVLDGHIRVQAALNKGLAEFHAHEVTGTEAEVLPLAIRPNLSHGVPLSYDERLDACCKVFKAMTDSEGVRPSDLTVAEALGLRESSVRNYRLKLESGGKLQASTKVAGKDGKKQAAKKATGGKPKGQRKGKAASPSSDETATGESQAAVSEDVPSQSVALVQDQADTEPAPMTDAEVLRAALILISTLDGKGWVDRSDRDELVKLLHDLNQVVPRALKAVQPVLAAAA